MTESKSLDVRASFGKRLREIRISRGLSQEALAFEAKLDRTYVSSCERGQRNISLENINRLARFGKHQNRRDDRCVGSQLGGV